MQVVRQRLEGAAIADGTVAVSCVLFIYLTACVSMTSTGPMRPEGSSFAFAL
jgi:hypothetical protein